jgi:hypothetical protein
MGWVSTAWRAAASGARWGALVLAIGLGPWAGPASAQVGMTRDEFEAVSGEAIDRYKAADGEEGLIYRDVWVSDRSKKQFAGRTAIELGPDQRVEKEVFFFDTPLANSSEGAADAVGIALNLLPPGTPRKILNSGRRPYEHGWVLWFDYGSGRYVNFFLDADETRIEAVVGGQEPVAI